MMVRHALCKVDISVLCVDQLEKIHGEVFVAMTSKFCPLVTKRILILDFCHLV